MNTRLVGKIVLPVVPYITVGLGLFVLHNAWLAMLGYHAGILAAISLSKTIIPIKPVFQRKGYWIPFVAALAGAGSGILLYVLWPLLSVPDDINSYLRSVGLDERTWPAFLAYFIIINPLIEEYYWRGHLASDTKRITLNDLLFSGYHLIVLAGRVETMWLIVAFLYLTTGAWFWRQLNRIHGGLLASTVSHATADISVILTIYYLSLR